MRLFYRASVAVGAEYTTIDGYNFLNNANNQTVWNKTKDKIAKFGNVALPIFIKLLMEEGLNLIKNQ